MANLFLYAMHVSSGQLQKLTRMCSKKAGEIRIGLIENAADVEAGSDNWLQGFREPLIREGYQTEVIDLKNWLETSSGLAEKLEEKDVIWVGGGNTYYLRWILKVTGADALIRKHVAKGKVYAGWSAGAMVAGPTLEGIEAMEPNRPVPELVTEGLGLTSQLIIPHLDNPDFAESARLTLERLKAAGIPTIPLNDDQVWVSSGNSSETI